MTMNLFIVVSLLSLSTEIYSGQSVEKCLEYSKPFAKDKITESVLRSAPSTLGKEVTEIGEFPHMAALGFENGKGNLQYLCGGSIISERFVLTTATCAKEGSIQPLKKIRVGDHDLISNSDDNDVQEISVKKITRHPSYRPPLVYNDIGLIELAEPIKFNRNVRPACLHQQSALPAGSRFSATGWGKVNFGEEASATLHKVYLDIFSHDECKKVYENVPKRKLRDGILEESMICAGGRNASKDTCKGDSGGPLQFFNQENNNYELVGITSLGKVCGVPGVPSVYTRIHSYIPWIENIVWK